MIVTILGENNHVGKSILAINLAALRAHHSGKVLLIDSDSHKCPFIWSVRRGNAGMKLKVPVLPILGNSLYSPLLKFEWVQFPGQGRAQPGEANP
jgi:hypothetical protein